MKNGIIFLSLYSIFFFNFSIFGEGPSEIWKEKKYKSERLTSFDKTGGNDDFILIPKQSSVTIANINGAGIIKHIWITLASKDPMIKRNAVLKITWDNASQPAVLVPLGDFFGQGWGEEYILNSQYIVAAPKKGKAWNSYFPMPFSKGAKIEIQNDSDLDIANFYFYIDYEKHLVSDVGELRFHSYWNRSLTSPSTSDQRENEWAVLKKTEPGPKSAEQNYTVLNVKGKGHFAGLQLYIDSPTPMWYGEGDDMIFIDSDSWPPRLHGTGTEDIFNTAWCPKEIFMHPYFGYPRVSEGTGWLGRTHLYRYWVESPLAFEKSFLFTLEHGHANNLTLDIVSVAYFYKTLSPDDNPQLPKKEDRQNKPEITFKELHKWRDSYRRENKSHVWGNE